MGANVTVYCLENVTDYLQFERLCHDLMALEGYTKIEPLGGFRDKGRDAVHVDKTKNSVFAYSVREDWQIKLIEDASKINNHGHNCDELIFITTAEFSASARDKALKEIKDVYGWDLKLYGVERLRVLLETSHPQIRKNHPQIFPPEFLKIEENYHPSEKEHVCIIYSADDVVFAGWLAQKLLSFGYRVCCDLTSHLLEEDTPDDIDDVVENQSAIVLSILSNSALADMEHTRQQTLAIRIGKEQNSEHLIAITLDADLPIDNLDRETKSLKFVNFSSNWVSGLKDLIQRMEKTHIPKPLVNGRSLAARAFNEDDVILEQEESVFLNCYEVMEIPKFIQRYKSDTDIDFEMSKGIQQIWAHRRVDNRTFLSFFNPPKEIANKYNFLPSGGGLTSDTDRLDGISVKNLISEFLKKAMYVKCVQKGLRYCSITNMYYFPDGLFTGNRLAYSKPDGKNTRVNVVGERKYWTPSKEEFYRYHLSPTFYVSQNLFANHVIMIRIRLRITDTNNRPLASKKAFSRRKHLTNNWWNKEWGDRFFAISHFLSDNGEIIIGSKRNEQIRINSNPKELISPISINETQIDLLKSQKIRLWAGDFEDNNEKGGNDEE